MTMSPYVAREARNRIQYLDYFFETPDSWDCGTTAADSTIGAPYKWMHTKSRFVPSSVAMYDMIFSEILPEHVTEWKSSALRSVIQQAKGERFDVELTIDVIMGWLRKPDVWNNVGNYGKFITVDSLYLEEDALFFSEQRWSLICKAVATKGSVMPRAAIDALDDSIFAKEEWMMMNYNRFVEAAIELDYDASVARVLTQPRRDREVTDNFIGTLDTQYGAAMPWLAALESLMPEASKFEGDENTLQKKVVRAHKSGLLPKDILKWSKLGVPFKQMLTYSETGIDEEILSMLLSREPGSTE